MQLPLNIKHESDYSSDDFIISCCNLEAYNLLKDSVSWPDNRLLIIGEEGSGKTHLASLWQEESNAVILKENDDFHQYENSKASLIIENIENIKNEDYLFHLINFAKTNSESLLMTAEKAPHFKLNDLQSRINATHKTLIKKPDDELLQIILQKSFSDRQLRVSKEVVDYIMTRTERSFAFIKNLVESIDKLSLEEKRNITIPLVKKVMENKIPQEADASQEEPAY